MGKHSAIESFIGFFAAAAMVFSSGGSTAIAGAGSAGIYASARYEMFRAMPLDDGPFSFSPHRYFAVDDGSIGHESVSRVTITNIGASNITIAAPALVQANFSARFDMTQSVTLAPADTLQLVVYVTPLSAGSLSGTVRYGLSSAGTPYLDLPVQGSIMALD